LKGFNLIERLHSVSEARGLLRRALESNRPREEYVSVDDSLYRVASRPVDSPMDIPPHNRSVLDGYAARWIDIAAATEESPARLKLLGRIEIDHSDMPQLSVGSCYEVATGSIMPIGGDVVVPVEYARVRGGYVEVYRSFPGGYGVSIRGEDLRRGERIIDKGDIITEWHLGVLSSIGVSGVHVWARYRAIVASTGRELIEPGEEYRVGKVYASTGRLVKAYLSVRNIDVDYYGILPDDVEAISRFILDSVGKYDLVITTGGTSVGRGDASVRALREISDDIIHGFTLTPGRPGAVAIVSGKPVLALSGMPVAAVSELIAIWDPVYREFLGRRIPWEPVLKAKMARSYTSHPGMMNIVRTYTCIGRDGLETTPLRVTGSGILSTLVKANSILIIPEEVTGIEEGEEVEVLLTGSLGVCMGE